MKVLALDQSSKTSGWSFFDNRELIDYGHWSHDDEEIAVRIKKLCLDIKEKIEKFHPDEIAIENIQLQYGDIITFQKLAQVQGAIMVLCATLKIKYRFIYPTEWRAECNFLKGNIPNRKDQKIIAKKWCLNTYHMRCTEDEADAICIGYAYSRKYDNGLNWA